MCVNGSLRLSLPECPRRLCGGMEGLNLTYLISLLFPLKDVSYIFTGLFSKEEEMWQALVAWEASLPSGPSPEDAEPRISRGDNLHF